MRSIVMALSLCVPAMAALAQDAPAGAEPAQTVAVKAARERLVPYKTGYYYASKVNAASAGRIALALYLRPSKPGLRMQDVRLYLEDGEQMTPVPIREDGIFVYPLSESAAQHDGHLVINTRKGQLTASFALLPTVARDKWSVGTMRQVLGDARAAVKAAVPWLLRPFFFKVKSISVCGPEAGMQFALWDGDAAVQTLTADTPAVNDTDKPVFCRHFDGKEKLDDSLRVVLPEKAEVLLL